MLNRQLTHRKYTWDWDTIAQVILHDCKKIVWNDSFPALVITDFDHVASPWQTRASCARTSGTCRAWSDPPPAPEPRYTSAPPGSAASLGTWAQSLQLTLTLHFHHAELWKQKSPTLGTCIYWLNCTVNNNKVPVIMDMTPLFQTIHLHHHSTQVSSIDTQRLQSFNQLRIEIGASM